MNDKDMVFVRVYVDRMIADNQIAIVIPPCIAQKEFLPDLLKNAMKAQQESWKNPVKELGEETDDR